MRICAPQRQSRRYFPFRSILISKPDVQVLLRHLLNYFPERGQIGVSVIQSALVSKTECPALNFQAPVSHTWHRIIITDQPDKMALTSSGASLYKRRAVKVTSTDPRPSAVESKRVHFSISITSHFATRREHLASNAGNYNSRKETVIRLLCFTWHKI